MADKSTRTMRKARQKMRNEGGTLSMHTGHLLNCLLIVLAWCLPPPHGRGPSRASVHIIPFFRAPRERGHQLQLSACFCSSHPHLRLRFYDDKNAGLLPHAQRAAEVA